MMKSRISFARYRKEVLTPVFTATGVLALFALSLWLFLPVNCTRDECMMSFERLNHGRFDLWLTFAPVTAIVITCVMVYLVHYYSAEKFDPVSGLTLLAFITSILAFLTQISVACLSWLTALAGVGISIIAIVSSLVNKSASKTPHFFWGNFLALAANIVLSILGYAYALRWWELFGD